MGVTAQGNSDIDQFLPEDWGMSEWNDSMFCGGVEDPAKEAIYDQFPDDTWDGLSTREECFYFC